MLQNTYRYDSFQATLTMTQSVTERAPVPPFDRKIKKVFYAIYKFVGPQATNETTSKVLPVEL